MAQSTKTMKTRIQLKSDTETNWNKAGPTENSNGFVPLLGEIIVYTPDDSHRFSRLKVGDGSTNVVSLPFLDAGTIGGEVIPAPEYEILSYANFDSFPLLGEANKIYIDLQKYKIYCYNGGRYRLLSDVNYTAETTQVSVINNFNAGMYTQLSALDGVLTIRHGSQPQLSALKTSVVKSITKEGES